MVQFDWLSPITVIYRPIHNPRSAASLAFHYPVPQHVIDCATRYHNAASITIIISSIRSKLRTQSKWTNRLSEKAAAITFNQRWLQDRQTIGTIHFAHHLDPSISSSHPAPQSLSALLLPVSFRTVTSPLSFSLHPPFRSGDLLPTRTHACLRLARTLCAKCRYHILNFGFNLLIRTSRVVPIGMVTHSDIKTVLADIH